MKFISAGHCSKPGSTFDSGAVGVNNRLEASETVKIRNAVIALLKQQGHTDIIQDADGESLGQYLTRIQPGTASVTVEFHFDAFNKVASGTTGIVSATPTVNSIAFAKELAKATSTILGIPVRDRGTGKGYITETDSNRGRLGLMRKAGTVCLLEVCYIDNPNDIAKYDADFDRLIAEYARIIQKYDVMI